MRRGWLPGSKHSKDYIFLNIDFGVLAYIFGVMFGIGHLLSESICRKLGKHRSLFISFTAGLSIAYLFLELFPLLFQEGKQVSEVVFLFVMLGFLLLFIFEKYVYQHSKLKLMAREISLLHAFGFFFYHLAVGIILVKLMELGWEKTALFFIPTFLYAVFGEVSINEISERVKENWVAKTLLVLSSLLGVGIARLIVISNGLYYVLLGFLVGGFTYLIVRDSLPRDKEGDLMGIVLGVTLYTFLILMLWIV